jgi:serine/threonine-protein kinase
MAEEKPKKLGKYELLALLATGGMAEIHLARQTGIRGFERLVVVKKILPHLAREEEFLEMFFDEARIAARLNHINIVQIYDLGQEGDDYFIAMEFLEGESLGYLVKEARKSGYVMPPALAAGIVAQICDGLDYAHKLLDDNGKPLNIVHRDVSPHNVIVLYSGGVKLVDFGIAKASSQMHQTRTGMTKGKLTYMAPEICLGKKASPCSDIFSLGVILWELLARKRLFKRPNEAATVQAVLSGSIPRLRNIRPEVTPQLENISIRALHKNPDDRYQTAAEFGAAIRDHLRNVGAAASAQEIAAYMRNAFSDRARTKRWLLDELQAKGEVALSPEMLKPITDVSLPTSSQLMDSRTAERLAVGTVEVDNSPEPIKDAITDVGPPPSPPPPPLPKEEEFPTVVTAAPDLESQTEEETLPSTSRKKRSFAWLILLLLIVGGSAVGYLFYTGQLSFRSEPPEPDIPKAPKKQAAVVVAPIPRDAGTKPDAGEAPDAGESVKTAVVKPDEDLQPDVEEPKPALEVKTLLTIRSRPHGCRVKVNGNEIPGVTPIERTSVEPDQEHIVTVLCKKHRKQTKKVKGLQGERIVVDFDPGRIPTPKKPKFGVLRLTTKPWSQVYLGKRSLGMTPLMGLKLPAGRHILTAINKEFKIRKKFTVTIKPGKTVTKTVNLKR